MEQEEKKPVKQIRNGNVKLAIWENSSKDGDTFHTVSVSRIYRASDGVKFTSNLSASDIGNLILAATRSGLWLSDPRAARAENDSADSDEEAA
jgi:hypothetical protein